MHTILFIIILLFSRCLRKLKNNKTGGSDGLVGELLKYGGSGMVDLLQQLFSVIWREEIVPPQWREGLIVNLLKKGDKEDPGNYITECSRKGFLYLMIGWYNIWMKVKHYMKGKLALERKGVV